MLVFVRVFVRTRSVRMTGGRTAGLAAGGGPLGKRKIIFVRYGTCARNRLLWVRRSWTTNMRILLSGVILSALTLPCFAQNVLKSEPLVLAPYEIAYVQDGSCPAGKVLKVTGAIRGLHRKKACVMLAADQASLAVATP